MFKMPDDPNVPILMISAGSGIAPFRSFWQQRMLLHWPRSTAWLYYGCRNEMENGRPRGETGQDFHGSGRVGFFSFGSGRVGSNLNKIFGSIRVKIGSKFSALRVKIESKFGAL